MSESLTFKGKVKDTSEKAKRLSTSPFDSYKEKRAKLAVEARKRAIVARQIEFPSWDGESAIHGTVWYPEDYPEKTPRAIVQLIHGMSEHIGRYDDFARFLAMHGYAVCGHDHIGHGLSVASEELFGYMPPENGADVLIEDVDTLRKIAQEAFDSELPYIMFGHSMGSLTLRVYLTRYGEGITGAIIAGTAHEPRSLARAGNVITTSVAAMRGGTSKLSLITSMADNVFQRKIEDPQSDYDWISVDRDNIDRFLEDDLSGFEFTLGGYTALTWLALEAADHELARRVPSEIALLFASGMEDPVGNYGMGVKQAVAMMLEVGSRDVEMILYEGMRHEILNEANSSEVYDDMLSWIEKQIS